MRRMMGWVAAGMVMVTGSAVMPVLAGDGTPAEPGPMGQVVIAMLKAANTGDYVTAKSFYIEQSSTIKSIGTGDQEKSYWEFVTKGGSLVFSQDKTRVTDEKEEGEQGKVKVRLWSGSTGKGVSYDYILKKLDGKWMIDHKL